MALNLDNDDDSGVFVIDEDEDEEAVALDAASVRKALNAPLSVPDKELLENVEQEEEDNEEEGDPEEDSAPVVRITHSCSVMLTCTSRSSKKLRK